MRRVSFFVASSLLLVFGQLGLSNASIAGETEERSPFTVVLLPDTQKYTIMSRDNNPYFAQTQWIYDSAASQNIKFAVHLGDLVEHANSYREEWEIASDAHAILEQGPNPVPYSVIPGNHDYTGSGSPDYTRNASMYNQYFGPDRFEDQSWYGGHQGTTNQNNYTFFSAAGMEFMVVSLDMLPTDETLAWANGVVQSHPDHRVIVATHRYLESDGTRSTDRIYNGIQGNNGTDIFNKLVKGNSNVFMTVSGHIGYEAMNVATIDAGGNVYEILTDYQTLSGGGQGWLRTLEFLPEQNEIVVGSYSPVLDQHDFGGGERSLYYDMGATPAHTYGSYKSAIENTPGLVSHWSLGETGGNTAVDSLGSNNGTYHATTTLGQTGILGSDDTAALFDGANGHVEVADAASLDPGTGAFAIEFWVKTEPGYAHPSNHFEFIEKQALATSGNDAFQVWHRNTGLIAFNCQDQYSTNTPYNVEVSTSDSFLLDDEWHHIVALRTVTEDAETEGELQLWVDGSMRDSALYYDSKNITPLAPLLIGCGNNGFSDGLIDEVAYYNVALTRQQIVEHYALGLSSPEVPGDANGDGKVDGSDVTILAGNWQVGVNPSDTTVVTWSMGDFNGDGQVDGSDVTILAGNWQNGVTKVAASVPEPNMMLLALSMTVGILFWKHRK